MQNSACDHDSCIRCDTRCEIIVEKMWVQDSREPHLLLKKSQNHSKSQADIKKVRLNDAFTLFIEKGLI